MTLTLRGTLGDRDRQLTVSSSDVNWSFADIGQGRESILGSVRTPDAVLVARIRAGDEEALAEAYRSYCAVVFGTARRTTASRAIAEDVLQEVFCALWCHPERFDPERGSLRAYLCGIARRRAIDFMRSDARRVLREERSETSGGALPGPDCEVAHFETAGAVRHALERLPEDQRRVVELAFWGGRTHFEIADELGLPAGTVKSRLRLARAKLVDLLGELVMEPA